MLPWDSWHASDLLQDGQPAPEELRLLDSVASVTALPSPPLTKLRRLYAADDRLHAPQTVTSFTNLPRPPEGRPSPTAPMTRRDPTP
jgi:hypothetical protein